MIKYAFIIIIIIVVVINSQETRNTRQSLKLTNVPIQARNKYHTQW